MRVKDYSNNVIANRMLGLAKRINDFIIEEHGKHSAFDFRPKYKGTFKTKSVVTGEDIEVKLNASMPSPELLSLSQTLVRPSDEPLAALKIFKEKTDYHPGSREVGFDVLTDTGEATIVAIGDGNPSIDNAEIVLGRNLQPVCKIAQGIEITRDDVQAMDLRRDRGWAPLVDLVNEKTQAKIKNMDRAHDRLVWNGAEIKGVAGGRILGVKDFKGTDVNNFMSEAPTAFLVEQVLARLDDGSEGGPKLTWFDKHSDAIIADLARGIGMIGDKGTHSVNTLVIPFNIALQRLGLRRTSDVDSTPLIEWFTRAMKLATGRDCQIVQSNALQTSASTSKTRRGAGWLDQTGFMVLDSDVANQAVATVEPRIVLPSVVNKYGTIEMIMQQKTAGFQLYKPASMYCGTHIQLYGNVS